MHGECLPNITGHPLKAFELAAETEILPFRSRHIGFHLSLNIGQRCTCISEGECLAFRIDIDPRGVEGTVQCCLQDYPFLIANLSFRNKLTRLQRLRILLHRGNESDKPWPFYVYREGEYFHVHCVVFLRKLQYRTGLRHTRYSEVNTCHHLEVLITSAK